MNTSLPTFNQEELSNFKNAELATIYNGFVVELSDVNPIKKFADKKSALRRVSQIQETYIERVKMLNEAKHQKTKTNATKVKKTIKAKDDTKIHGLDKDFEWQITAGTKIRKGTILRLIADAHIEKCYFIEDLINYLVEKAPKNPKRKSMTSLYAAEYIKWYKNKGSLELYKSCNEEE